MDNLSNGALLLFSGLVAFLITAFSIPVVVRVANVKRLFDEPTQRKSHRKKIPTLGGISLFAGFTIAAGSFISYQHMPSLQYVLVASIIIFFIGMKDDLVGITPLKKLLGQIVAALVLIIPGNLSLSSLHGFFGIYHISPVTSVLITIFVIVLIINSINLIDGVDGLAASVGMLAATFFGVWFYLSGNPEYSLISVALFGCLFAFFWYNISKGKYKIFMGDTGSLLMGLILSVQVILFNQQNIGLTSAFALKSAPAVSIAVLILPMFDTLRVFIIRMIRGRSPFLADKNHLHHLLLRLDFSHIQTTILLMLVNAAFIMLALLLQHIGIFWLTLTIFTVATAASILLERKVHKHNHHRAPNDL
ncbi:MAG: undecaprenyl/decaprenyl-phosphate alpha-N-acetylglucosaminyl 1-phosphate transferase [Bacteroidales bacterium]|jgi:UDP-N-acetylmuramyl pentapeptide phosphotransferase/UDP-N-acetylglucosamine-1-phosphate transferase|nr:undecaprenyl/decaprenyl-phosphate alpha-N-acetylglucosaminyl 1-phosphate transferase [Bacteroidales bacterium]